MTRTRCSVFSSSTTRRTFGRSCDACWPHSALDESVKPLVNCDFGQEDETMPMYNPNNERIKRQYFVYLREAKRHSEATVDAVAKALSRFESANKFRDFKCFHHLQAVNQLQAPPCRARESAQRRAT
jgi:hypothetical protein